jgi:HAE1 family hydrophobic/amphiphilic exporter-1
VNGTVASYFREDGEEYDIRVSYAPEFRETVDDIENIVVYNAAGDGVRIRDIGQIVERMTPPTIERKDRERMVTISGVVASGYALSDLVTATEKVLSEMDLPMEVTYHIGGSYEDQQEVFGDLITLMVLIVILVFIVMAAQFESLIDPFVIMFSIPFTFTGVFLGLSVTGTPLGVMAMIGILILMGVVVKNGIVLIDYTKLCRERGMSIIDATVAAGRSRLRPILMTTLTTVLGMLPMALGTGEGSEMWRSMGMTVAWGLSVSTLITLVLIPVLYSVMAKKDVREDSEEMTNAEILELRIEN